MVNSVSKLLTNKWVLYIVFGVVLFHIFGYMMAGNVNIVLLFILSCLIVNLFTKNMVLILAISLLIAHFVKGSVMIKEGLENKRIRESLENMQEAEKGKKTEENDAPTPTHHGNSHIVTNVSAAAASIHGEEPESFEVGMKNKSQMGSRIDYSSTLEQAYDNLDKILGSDGIQKLTGDTQKLMQQQMKLAEAMKTMGPVVENASKMLETLNSSGMGIDKLLKNTSSIQGLLGSK